MDVHARVVARIHHLLGEQLVVNLLKAVTAAFLVVFYRLRLGVLLCNVLILLNATQ